MPKAITIWLGLLMGLFISGQGCTTDNDATNAEVAVNEIAPEPEPLVYLTVLGTVQDAGSPQIACQKDCCKDLFESPAPSRMVVSLGLTDLRNNATYLFEATPDMPRQLDLLNRVSEQESNKMPNGVFLTHAHIGHYTGLMYFGKEAMNADRVPVYSLPRMKNFLETNGPWSQLVSTNNIQLNELMAAEPLELEKELTVTPLLVPHRDEFSETAGFLIDGPQKSALFIPDIDKWSKWEQDIVALVKMVDYAFLDATFYDAEEINNRDISEIPHPFVVESMDAFNELAEADKAKIFFIHFNHTNPLLDPDSEQQNTIKDAGFNAAAVEMIFAL